MVDKQKKKRKCWCCGRKLITMFRGCRCQHIFCNACIDPQTHACPHIDEYVAAQEQIAAARNTA